MKVVQINAVYGTGSTGKMVQDISAKLKEQGHQPYAFWATACRSDENAKLIRVGSTMDHKLHALLRRMDGKQGWHSRAATRRACAEILKIEPDVVHLHNLHSNYLHLPTLLKFLGEHHIPTLLTLHDCWFFTGGCYHYLTCDGWMTDCGKCHALKLKGIAQRMLEEKRKLFSNIRCLAVNGVSEWTAQAARSSILSHGQIRCIYNWVDTAVFKPRSDAAQVRERYGIPEGHKLILGVSQGWSPQKGLDEFTMLADALREEATVILVGQDQGVPQRENLRCIGFTSNVQELAALYSAADVFVNPSRAETFGLVTAEAMACGTPVVAYRNFGSAELVAPQCGVLVPDGDTRQLLEQVRCVLHGDRGKYRIPCRQWVCEQFDKDGQIQKYIEFYMQLAAQSRSDDRDIGKV